MKILALDLGRHTGWCRLDTGALAPARAAGNYTSPEITYGTQDNGGDDAVLFDRVMAFDDWIWHELFEFDPDCIAFEASGYGRRGHALAAFWSYYGVILTAGRASMKGSSRFESVNASTLKKWATGSGRAGKELMIHEATTRLQPIAPPSALPAHDEADAILLALYVKEKLTTAALVGR